MNEPVMSRRFLIVGCKSDALPLPAWQVAADQRDWDLVLLDAAPGQRWATMHAFLSASPGRWANHAHIWLLPEGLEMSVADANRFFGLVDGLQLRLAQPAFASAGRFDNPMALHNSAYALRYTGWVDAVAPCFSAALLKQVLASLAHLDDRQGAELSWSHRLESAATQCAIVDRVTVTWSPRGSAGGPGACRSDDALPLAYGGMTPDGKVESLFGDDGRGFVMRLCRGHVETLQDRDAVLGRIFALHLEARRMAQQHLDGPAPAAACPQAPAPAAAPPIAASLRVSGSRRDDPAAVSQRLAAARQRVAQSKVGRAVDAANAP